MPLSNLLVVWIKAFKVSHFYPLFTQSNTFSSTQLKHTHAQLRKSIRTAQHTSAFLSTSEDCSSFPSLAAWRNPPGRDAASYYRPLSIRERRLTEAGFQLPFVASQLGSACMCMDITWEKFLFPKFMHMKHTALEVKCHCGPTGRGRRGGGVV